MATKQILITDHPWPDLQTEQQAASEAGATLLAAATSSTPLEELLETADGVLNGFTPITAQHIERMKRCVVICRWGIGVDNIDVEAATRAGIQVANVPDYCIEEVSTHVIALVLAANRKLFSLYDQSRAGGWGFAAIRPVCRLQEQTLGVIGYGRIGRAVAQKAASLGMRVLWYDPYCTRNESAGNRADLETVLRTSDYVSMHLPLTQETLGILDEQKLSLMKPEAYLINAARGEVVNSDALATRLRKGLIQGAYLDVLPEEPPPAGHPLLETGAVLTGHSAWYSEQALVELRQKAIRQVASALLGEPVEYPVNDPQQSSGRRSTERPH